MDTIVESARPRVGRREFLLGSAATTALAGAGLTATTVSAGGSRCPFPGGPAPDPIPGGLDLTGAGLPAPYDGVIHIYIPGPEGLALPFSGTPAQGRNTEPAVITNFQGDTAVGLLVGSAHGNDGADYGVEIDVRVSEGVYETGGEEHRGLFALF